MKKMLVLGMTVLILSMLVIGCGGIGEASIRVNNLNSETIIMVTAGFGSTQWKNLNITTGQSKTFTFDVTDGQRGFIGVYTSSGGPSIDVTYNRGDSITVTYTSEGNLIRN